jgi:hypothetical protein
VEARHRPLTHTSGRIYLNHIDTYHARADAEGAAWLAGKADTATMCGIVKRRFVTSGKMLPPRRRPSESANCKETAAGKARAEQLNAELEARIARLKSILRRGLDREAAIDLNAMLRTDEFPPLDLGDDGVATPRPIWSAPPEPGPMLVSSAQSLAMNSDWLLPVKSSHGKKWSTSELRWRAKSGYGNIHHAMRRLCGRIRMTSPAITAALHISLLAYRSGIERVFSTSRN